MALFLGCPCVTGLLVQTMTVGRRQINFHMGQHPIVWSLIILLGVEVNLGLSVTVLIIPLGFLFLGEPNHGLVFTLGQIRALGSIVYPICMRLMYPILLDLIFMPLNLGPTLMVLIRISLCPLELHFGI